MKTLLKLFCFLAVFVLSSLNSFSQLNGTYTIGNGGNYPAINSAVSAVVSQGVSGPVVFNILTGTYNENIKILSNIPGAGTVNTVTFQSQVGNADSVKIDSICIGGAYLNFRKLTINKLVELFTCSYVNINDNVFNFSSIFYRTQLAACNHITISGNKNIHNIIIFDEFGLFVNNIRILNNTLTGAIRTYFCQFISIENNITDSIRIQRCGGVNISKNKIYNQFVVEACDGLTIVNNFIIGQCGSSRGIIIAGINYGNILFNSFVSECSNDTAVMSGINSNLSFINNLYINLSSGFVYSFFDNSALFSDYNNYYNGTNFNLISYNGSIYNNVADFNTASTLDSHSNSQPVHFVSSTDLHLTGSSIGDVQLAGIPNALVTDDIDGNPRNPVHPYKGADEADVPLPVEFKSFTSSVKNNDVQLKWTTASETNNSGFDVERSSAEGGVKSETSNDWRKIGFVQGIGTTSSLKNYEFTDRNLLSGEYKYRLKQIDYNGNYEYYNLSNEVVIGIPEKFSLSQNYPNPFNPTTKINYDIPKDGMVSLKIYDIRGREIRTIIDEFKASGYYTAEFNGTNLSSGIYYYKLESESSEGGFIDWKKMIFLK